MDLRVSGVQSSKMPAAAMTELLQRFARGDKQAEADLLPRVYRELHLMAKLHLKGERPDHTLQATALVHEAYLKLIGKSDIDWQSRAHFFAVASQTMRRILVDYARERAAGKRGGGAARISLDEGLVVSPEQCDLVEELDGALDRLAVLSPRQAKVVELRFFGGLSEEEIAQILNLSARTVKRDWRKARAWLYGELSR
jgi:RNA polymerase sigma factor (TIGR02999 family)